VLFVAKGRVIKGVLLSNLELVRAWRVRGSRRLVAVGVLACADLSRHLCQRLESSPGLSSHWEFNRRTVHLCSTIRITSCITREAVQLQQCLLPIVNADARALLHKVCREAVNTTLWKLLAASPARMLIPIARIVQFSTPLEVLEDQCCREEKGISRSFSFPQSGARGMGKCVGRKMGLIKGLTARRRADAT
jgi:hypothetical protein